MEKDGVLDLKPKEAKSLVKSFTEKETKMTVENHTN